MILRRPTSNAVLFRLLVRLNLSAGASIAQHRAVAALVDTQEGRIPEPSALPSFEELQAVVGFPEHYAEEARYAVSQPAPAQAPAVSGAGAGPVLDTACLPARLEYVNALHARSGALWPA